MTKTLLSGLAVLRSRPMSMTKTLLSGLAVLVSLFLTTSTHAEEPGSDLSKEAAIKIISTLEKLNARHYQVIHIADGAQREKDGFEHHHAKKISFYGPKDDRNATRTLRHCTMLYSSEYAWYLQREGRDARGFFLEIISQTQGRVFVR